MPGEITEKGKKRRFHPNPLEGDGTSRVAFVKAPFPNSLSAFGASLVLLAVAGFAPQTLPLPTKRGRATAGGENT